MKEISAVAATNLGGQFHGSLLGMIFDAGTMVQLVLLLLLLFSVISWAIIITKHRMLRRIRKENDLFLEAYMQSNRMSDLVPEAKRYNHSTLAEVFRVGYAELSKLTKTTRGTTPGRENEDAPPATVELQGIDNVERSLNRAGNAEATKLESTLGFLATTGSACPFIGLFGTVWGIMDTFKSIGARGSATLAVVAPGISEALIATAAGLAAAIPAVIFYNYYLGRIKTLGLEMDNFASEFLNIVERYYVKH